MTCPHPLSDANTQEESLCLPKGCSTGSFLKMPLWLNMARASNKRGGGGGCTSPPPSPSLPPPPSPEVPPGQVGAVTPRPPTMGGGKGRGRYWRKAHPLPNGARVSHPATAHIARMPRMLVMSSVPLRPAQGAMCRGCAELSHNRKGWYFVAILFSLQ